jgi:hypothetical protein
MLEKIKTIQMVGDCKSHTELSCDINAQQMLGLVSRVNQALNVSKFIFWHLKENFQFYILSLFVV